MEKCVNPACDKPVPRPDMKYCTRNCYHIARNKWRETPRQCEVCGTDYYPHAKESPAGFEKRRSCSRRCQPFLGKVEKPVRKPDTPAFVPPPNVKNVDEYLRVEKRYARYAEQGLRY